MSQVSLKSRLLHNLGANAYGQLITVVIQLASVPLFLHFWGLELYGEWLILSAIPAYLSLSDIGFSSVAANDMTMRVARGDQSGTLEVFQSIWVFICGVSLLVGLILGCLIIAFPINDLFSISHISVAQTKQVLLLLMLYVLVGLQGGVLSAGFRSVGRYAFGTVMNHHIRLVEWLFSIVALCLGGSVVDVALITLIVRLIGLVVLWVTYSTQIPWLSLGYHAATLRKIRELLKPALAFMSFPLGMAISLQGMVLVIGAISGSAAVVIFSAYRTLTRLLVQVITMLNQSVWPEISVAYGAGKIELVAKLHRQCSSITFWISLAAIAALGLFGDWFIGLWTRHSFEANHLLLFFLLVTTFLNVLWQASWVVLMATNKHQTISVLFIACAAGGLLLSALVIPLFGLKGVGLALVVAEAPLLFIAINSTLILLGDNWKKYIKSVISNPINRMGVSL